jgi:hypothetical protein
MTPTEKKLEEYLDAHKNEFGVSTVNALVDLSIDCFKLVKERGDKLKVCDISNYILTTWDVAVRRTEKAYLDMLYKNNNKSKKKTK